jgi:ribosomal protein S17E
MADKVQNVRTNVYINNKDAGKNLRTLQKESRKLRNEIAGLTPGTKQYIAATKRMREVSGTIRNINKEIRGMNNAWRQAKQVFVGAVGAFGFTELIRGFGNVLTGVKNTRKEFEVYEAVLTNALGSQREANKQLAMMERLASETPFSIKELTDSYVKLVNRGFKPTSAEIIKLGDLTSSLGKSYDQLVEAMLDAQTGEFERLKEFGIKARKEGEQVRFTFKGPGDTVEFTEDAIKNYIMSLGDLAEIKGSMASIAATTTGAESNLADVYDSLANTIGKRLNPAYGNFLRSLSKSLGLLQRWVGLRPSDEMEKSRMALLGMKVQLMDTNMATEKRVTIINELKKQYPGYLSDLDAEKTTNQELLPLLDEINMHLIKRIALQQAQEELNQKQEDYAYHVGRQAQNMVELAELTGKVADAENIMLTENVDLLTQAEILWEKLNSPMMGDAGKIGRLIYNEIKPTKKVIDAYNDSVDRALANVSKINAQVDQMLGIDKLDATIANEEAEEKARLDRMGRQAEREVQEIAKLEKFKFDEKMIIVRDFISREAGMISGWQGRLPETV